MNAGGGGRPTTSAGAIVGAGGGGRGRAGRAASGKRLDDVAEEGREEEEEWESSAGNDQEQVDDMFGDLVKEFEEVKTKLAETVDPNEARFNDLKELIQGIKNNQVARPFSNIPLLLLSFFLTLSPSLSFSSAHFSRQM